MKNSPYTFSYCPLRHLIASSLCWCHIFLIHQIIEEQTVQLEDANSNYKLIRHVECSCVDTVLGEYRSKGLRDSDAAESLTLGTMCCTHDNITISIYTGAIMFTPS